MKPILAKGQLTTWKDDRGFGFVRPSNGGKDVFLHISVLPETSRRPKVGDTILYQREITPKGKVRAAKASIQGVVSRSRLTPQHQPKPCKQRGSLKSLVGVIIVTVSGLIGILSWFSDSPEISTAVFDSMAVVRDPNCLIKGNISISTGNKLYHLPGMEDYDNTKISPEHGERWFCTEEEALKNGWRKAPR